ncbi:hypothetical protein ACFY9N_05800 [Microbacterium sp. NPDC008134]|uniref:hypothetical protein n=1 Tax=Microbacterium sp. NPDC008134 TaxID=3364183 RepID=UPI0036F0614C
MQGVIVNLLDDFWKLYSLTLRDIREEKPDTFNKLAVILNRFQGPSAGDAFFPDGADDILGEAVQDAGWYVSWEAAYLWTATHPVTRARIRFVEGDVYDETPTEDGRR